MIHQVKGDIYTHQGTGNSARGCSKRPNESGSRPVTLHEKLPCYAQGLPPLVSSESPEARRSVDVGWRRQRPYHQPPDPGRRIMTMGLNRGRPLSATSITHLRSN